MPMATEHWMNRGSIGDFFTIVPFHGNYAAQWNQFALQKVMAEERECWSTVASLGVLLNGVLVDLIAVSKTTVLAAAKMAWSVEV